MSVLEGKVAQCEAALAACRNSKKEAQTTAKDSAAKIKAIEIEVNDVQYPLHLLCYLTLSNCFALFCHITLFHHRLISTAVGEACNGTSTSRGADPGPCSPTGCSSEGRRSLPCGDQGNGDDAGRNFRMCYYEGFIHESIVISSMT